MAQYRSPRPSGVELFMTETLPQITALISDYRKWEKQTELKQQEMNATAKYRQDTLDAKTKDREAGNFRSMLSTLDDDDSKLSFLKGFQSSSSAGGIDVSSLISSTENEIQSNKKGEMFFNDFRLGQVSDLELAWTPHYGLDPNDKEDLKWFNQAKDIQTRRESTVKNTYSKISSLASLVTALKDPTGKIPTELQEMGADLREQLLDLYNSGGPIKPLMIGGKKIVLPSNIEELSTQDIMDTVAGQLRKEEMEEGYAELLSGIGLPLDEPDMVEDEPLTDLLLEEFAPMEAPLPSRESVWKMYENTGDATVRPDIGIQPDVPDPVTDAPLTDILLQEFAPWAAPPLPEVPSMDIIKSGISSSVVNINGIQKEITPTELSVLQKSGKRWNLLPEKRKESIAGKLAKKFNTTKDAIKAMTPALTEVIEPPKIDNFVMVKEGVSKSKIELNGIQANVSPSELAVLRGQARFGLNAKTKGRLIKTLAKKFNVTEDDIKKLPFAKYKRK